MCINRKLLFALAIPLSLCYSQRDTITYDSVSGDYIIKYFPEDEYGNKTDSAVIVLFEPATKIDPRVLCAAYQAASANGFLYNYTCSNGIGSHQNLVDFTLEFGRNILVIDRTPADGWHSTRENDIEEEKLIVGRRWNWHGDSGLKPGRSWLVGAIESNGLPGIVNAYFQGKTKRTILAFPDEGPGYELTLQLMQLRTFPSNRVVRKTIGPISPPASFVALSFLDTLISYTRQSAELGWLGRSRDDDCDDDERPDDGITKNIEKRLEKTKKELSKGDSTKARKELEKLVDKVERIWKRSQDEEKKHKGEQRERKQDVIMTGEAYALLLYNTEYLIDRLPDGKEKKGEKEKKGGDKDDD